MAHKKCVASTLNTERRGRGENTTTVGKLEPASGCGGGGGGGCYVYGKGERTVRERACYMLRTTKRRRITVVGGERGV